MARPTQVSPSIGPLSGAESTVNATQAIIGVGPSYSLGGRTYVGRDPGLWTGPVAATAVQTTPAVIQAVPVTPYSSGYDATGTTSSHDTLSAVAASSPWDPRKSPLPWIGIGLAVYVAWHLKVAKR